MATNNDKDQNLEEDPKEKKQLDSMERGLQNQLRQAEDADHKIHIKQGTAGLYKPNTCYEFKVPIQKDTEDQSPIAGVFNYIKEAISPSPKYETIERCTNRYGDQPNLSINRKPTSIL
ncbi:MAG: hypothetical protein EOP06_10250, partial [Proteobacteria bacterium]